MSIIIPEIAEIVKFYKPEVIEKIARETGFVERESKLGGIEFLSLMTQGLYSNPNATLSLMSGMLKEINPELEISVPGIQQRIVGSGRDFLKGMLSEAMKIEVSQGIDESIPELLREFSKVHLLDSSQVSLPASLSERWAGSGGSASTAGMKIQLMLDYKSGQYERIVIEAGKSADQSYMKEAVKIVNSEELIIYDLGYFDTNCMIDLAERGAYFLSRFNHRSGLYKKKEDGTFEKFGLEKELKKVSRKGQTRFEFTLWLCKDGRDLQIRLIAEMVPKETANKRRYKAKKTAKKKGRKPTKKHLYMQNWSLYITNAGVDKLPTKAISIVYRLRWYIEIVFKAWKSYNGLDQVRGEREERIECFIYGRLIMAVIMTFLFGSIKRHVWHTKGREASLLKVISHFQDKGKKSLCVIIDPESFGKFLYTEFFEACRLCLMDSRKRLSTAQKVRLANAA
ncbi:IS4 family transposase [Candidatus Poribacteria bacterium]|nr:IS4 family transposase [Candidatus Poribacteria bacterium]